MYENPLEDRIGRKRFCDITGMTVSGSSAIAKILRLWRRQPTLENRAKRICSRREYFLWRPGAETFETDPASLTLNRMLDIARLDWSEEVCAAGDNPLEP